MIFFTSICANYLPKAMSLAESVKRHCPDARFVLCLVEREIPPVAKAFAGFDEVILAKDAGWDDFDGFMFRHSIVEASTAVKPRFLQYLFERFPDDRKFVYLDPDVLVYSNLSELESLLDHETIVVCPHLLRPGNIDMEISSLAHGSYNLGFLAVARSKNADDFVAWWAERLFYFCYDDQSRGIFTDQKWIDLAPCFYDVKILKHHGYDFATWSLLGSDLHRGSDGYIVNGDPLRFIHFSGLDSGTIDKAIEWWLTDRNKDTFVALFREYKQLLASHGQAELGKTPWSYATYADGRKIGKDARIAFRNRELWSRIRSPFASSDTEILAMARSLRSVSQGVSNQSTALDTTDEPPGILDRIARSVREVGIKSTVRKAIRKATGV